MARTTDKPRLAGVDPVELAADVVELVLAHVARFAMPLSPAVALDFRTPTRAEMANGTDLGLTVRQLVVFAQRGALGDWQDAGCALDAMQTVCSALYSQAGVPGTFGVGEAEESRDAALETDPEEEIGLVLIGAMARVHLAQGGSISPRELGVLAGITRQAATPIARELGAEAKPLAIPAQAARDWLRARPVPGF